VRPNRPDEPGQRPLSNPNRADGAGITHTRTTLTSPRPANATQIPFAQMSIADGRNGFVVYLLVHDVIRRIAVLLSGIQPRLELLQFIGF
jgi:hypothetical protein